jgi:hypothetical protein
MLIGLTGAAGAGKDTVASHLFKAHGCLKLALADPLYAMVAAMTGLPVEKMGDRKVKEADIAWIGTSPRRLLQTLGTEWGRGTLGDDIWIKNLFRRIDAYSHAMGRWSDKASFVVTDVRFANEAQAIRERGGHIIEIVRPTPLSGVPDEARRHSSEAGVPNELIDVSIVNDTDVAGLLERVDKALDWLLNDTMADSL